MTFSVPQVAAAVVVYPMQALSVRRLECITVCAKDEFFMIYYTSCSVFADLHRCLAKIFGGFAAKNEEAEATFVTCHHPHPTKKPAPGTVREISKNSLRKLHLFSIFFCSAFSKFSIGEKNKCSTEKFSSFFLSFCSRVSFCCVLCAKSFSKRQQELRILKWFRVPPPIAPSLPWPTAPVPHVARRTSQHPYYSSSSSSISVIYYCSPSCRQTMCNNIIDGGAGGGEVIIFRK